MSIFPKLTAQRLGTGYMIFRHGERMGYVFRVAGGWATVSAIPRQWRRSRPFKTAEDAAADRWGDPGRDAVRFTETSGISGAASSDWVAA